VGRRSRRPAYDCNLPIRKGLRLQQEEEREGFAKWKVGLRRGVSGAERYFTALVGAWNGRGGNFDPTKAS